MGNTVTAAKTWFSGRRGPWLFIFNGAVAIDDEKAKGYITIKYFIPNISSLHVIITARTGAAKEITLLASKFKYRCIPVESNL